MSVVLVESESKKSLVLEGITIERIQYAIAFLADERERKARYKRNAYVKSDRPRGRPKKTSPSEEPSGDSSGTESQKA